MKKRLLAITLIFLFVLQGCSKNESVYETTKNDETIKETDTSAQEETEFETESFTEEELLTLQIDDILKEMSLEQKIYQMFIITPEALTGYGCVTEAGAMTKSSMEKYPIGGLIYFAGNLVNAEQTKEMLDNTSKYAMDINGLPIFLCVDEEGGRVARIGNNDGFNVTQVQAMGNITTEEEAYEAGNTIGQYLSELGFNFDFAPDADVITNEKNTVIGDRSFGSDASIVSSYANAYSEGLHNNGVLSTFKHFPGHGATEGDTHEGFAYTNKTYEEMLKAELVPFANANEAGVDAIMISHISVPSILGDNTPCSLSYKMVTEVLRQDLEYDGLIITDAMGMGAIIKNYSCEESTVLAVKAGVDIILMPEDFEVAVDSLIEAVRSGDITEERIDESVGRIIGIKLQMKDNKNIF